MQKVDLNGLASLAREYDNIFIHPAGEMATPLSGDRFDAFLLMSDQIGDAAREELDPIYAVQLPDSPRSIAIVSGRTNLEACRQQKRNPHVRIYRGTMSPWDLAASLNFLHQHHSTSQRSAFAVEYLCTLPDLGKERQREQGGDRKSQAAREKHESEKAAIEAQESVCSKMNKAISCQKLAEDRWAKACCVFDVSRGTLSQTKTVYESSPPLFKQIKSGELTTAQATSEIRRQVKREAFAVRGPFEKPTDSKGLDGIRDGDCNKILPTLPRRRVRLAIVDPPYNIGVDYGNGSKCDRLPDAEYLGIHERWIKQMPDLLTPDGAVWVIINNEYAAEFVMMLKRAGLKMRGWIKWYETFGTNCANNFNRTSRHLLYFVRDPKRFVFNAEPIRRLSARALVYKDKRKSIDGMKIWDDVWDIPRLSGTSNERMPDVPTQLPEALIRPIVEACSDEGDLVLDPMCGSGTTPAVCKRVGRQCLGIEFNPEFARIARARVANTKGPLR